ncbi:MAG: transglutaminase domain-containing protein [Firmicutes bacterium]|nr:transglutaminase domain-containing protein [Bacillota bacterium]
MAKTQSSIKTVIFLLLLTLLGGSLGFGAFFYLKSTRPTSPNFDDAFSLADQRYKEARDLETDGEITLARLKYTQARELFERQGNQTKLNLANEGIARTIALARDYSLDGNALNNLFNEKIAGYRSNELPNWEIKGQVDFRFIDGQKRYFIQSLENLALQNPTVAGRISGWLSQRAALAGNYTPYALAPDLGYPLQPYRNPTSFLVRSRLVVETTKLPAYQVVRSWFPYPVNTPVQSGTLLSLQPLDAIKFPPQVEGEVGIAYTELKNMLRGPLTIDLEYQVQTREINKKIDPQWVGSYDPASELFQRYTRSEAHLEQSDPMKKTASDIVGDEKNPALKARLIYNWIGENIILQNVSYPLVTGASASHYALEKHRGDGLLMAYLFTDLCRCQGIPARVVAGYRLVPGSEAPIGWAEFYLPNYGWIPVDPGTAQTVCLSNTLTSVDKQRVKDYYFSNLDPLRVSFNQTSMAPLTPAKPSERSFSLMLLTPELECGGSNVSVDNLQYTLSATRQEPAPAVQPAQPSAPPPKP